jgi:hypothetical protein
MLGYIILGVLVCGAVGGIIEGASKSDKPKDPEPGKGKSPEPARSYSSSYSSGVQARSDWAERGETYEPGVGWVNRQGNVITADPGVAPQRRHLS